MTRLASLCVSFLLVVSTVAQSCPPGAVGAQNDVLPCNPTGPQPVAIIRGLCPGDKAAAVFRIAALPTPVRVLRGGILFAGGTSAVAATARLEIYDGVSIAANGQATLGPRVFRDATARPLAPNSLTMVDAGASGALIASGVMVVAFEMVSNPNEPFPGLGCLLGYTADFASDTQLTAGSPCTTPPGTNLIYDPSQGWFDATQLRINGVLACGQAFNGNWVIRACVAVPAGLFAGTGEDLHLGTSLNGVAAGSALACAGVGDVLALAVTSPNATFANAPHFLLVGGFATANAAPFSPLPGLFATPSAVLVGTGQLPPAGLSFSFSVPAAPGLSVLVQSAVVSSSAANGSYATSNANVLVLH